jgi:ERCC4-related helicase
MAMLVGIFLKTGILIVFLSTVLLSCAQKKETTMNNSVNWDKMDVSLRSELRDKLGNDSDSTIVVLASVSEDNDAFVDELEALGIQVRSRIGVVWTLVGNAASMAQASGKEYINRMELSQQRRIP